MLSVLPVIIGCLQRGSKDQWFTAKHNSMLSPLVLHQTNKSVRLNIALQSPIMAQGAGSCAGDNDPTCHCYLPPGECCSTSPCHLPCTYILPHIWQHIHDELSKSTKPPPLLSVPVANFLSELNHLLTRLPPLPLAHNTFLPSCHILTSPLPWGRDPPLLTSPLTWSQRSSPQLKPHKHASCLQDMRRQG